jgi:hypothetical protein
MTTTPTATKVLCPECRHENEPERIYCHECGTRLDRTAVRIKKEPLGDTHRRVKKMFDPQRAKLRALCFTGSKIILGAGLAAILLDLALPPDVPPPGKAQVLVSSFRLDLESMANKHQPAQKQFTEDQANAFVATALKAKQASLDKPLLPFKRAVLGFSKQRCSITAERSLLGYYSIYTTCVYSVAAKDGRLAAQIQSGHIGRLPLHPQIAQHMAPLFGDILSALDQDVKLVSKMRAVEFGDKNVTLTAP